MKRNKTLYLTTLALLAALTALFGLTPVGMLNLGVVYVTLLCLPVIVGTLSMGLQAGLILSLVFGTVSLITALNAPSALVSPILSAGVPYVILLCYLPRLCIPLLTRLVFTALRKRNDTLSMILAPVCGSLTNTVLYMGLMLILYRLIGVDSAPVLAAIAGVILLASACEAAVAAIVTLPIMKALQKSGILKKLDPTRA